MSIARNFLREHSSAYMNQTKNRDELNMDLPPICTMDNATPQEQCWRPAESAVQGCTHSPVSAFANFVAALRRTRRQQLTAEAADLLANMLGRAEADIVNVAIQMVIVCGQACVRLNGPLVAPI